MSDNWISVAERLPEKGRFYVLVWSQTLRVHSVILADTLKVGVKWNANKKYYSHWMPLTEPPESPIKSSEEK